MKHSSIRRTLSLAGSAAFALASLPFGLRSATAQEAKITQGTAADLGVMSISLKDANHPILGGTFGLGVSDVVCLGALKWD